MNYFTRFKVFLKIFFASSPHDYMNSCDQFVGRPSRQHLLSNDSEDLHEVQTDLPVVDDDETKKPLAQLIGQRILPVPGLGHVTEMG